MLFSLAAHKMSEYQAKIIAQHNLLRHKTYIYLPREDLQGVYMRLPVKLERYVLIKQMYCNRALHML